VERRNNTNNDQVIVINSLRKGLQPDFSTKTNNEDVEKAVKTEFNRRCNLIIPSMEKHLYYA